MRTEQISIANFPAIKREDAQLFLRALDDNTDQFTFQLFDDRVDRKDKRLARVLHGTLDEHYSTLVDYSRRGAGVFVTVNGTNLRGRTKECIKLVRAYFADLDGAPLKNILRLGLMPHIVTHTSPGRYGVFYNIEDAPLDEENFRRTQLTLAEFFESDPSICDLPRVMRLPGFPHQKDPQNQFVTQISSHASQLAIEGRTPFYTEAEFQQALATALAKHRRRKSVTSAALSGLPKRPPDWREGYEEGQRNNECARRAGSCLARGMSEDEALRECLLWDAEHNDPALGEAEVRATVASIARTHARNQVREASVPKPPHEPLEVGGFVFDGDIAIEPPKMLVKKVLPANGIAFIGGQSSAGKTFIAIALGVSLASGESFFGHQIKERVGVAYVALEGWSVFALRLAAAKIAAGVKGPIPFAWCGSVPVLTSKEGLDAFIKQLQSLDQEMRERFGVRLGAVFIDTTKACFDMEDENSNAEVARVCNTIRNIGNSIGGVMIPLHHYGKDAGTGLRGASAWRGAADVVMSVVADINQLTGNVSNRAFGIAKARDAEQGPLAPFILEWVKLGVDDDGEDYGTCIVKLDLARGLQTLARSNAPKSVRALDDACRSALGEHSQDVQLRKSVPHIRAVEIKHVKAKFCELYVTGEGDPKKAALAKDRAYRRALDKLPDAYEMGTGEGGGEWLWLKS
jgi:AAA domain/RepB DNA-primase from phage plasmid/Primase C terminal 1 (PriCT-1)